MQRTVDADAKTAESPTETTLVCGSSCSFAAAVVLAADVTAADADADAAVDSAADVTA